MFKSEFTSIDDYVIHTRYTEQMYVNLQLSQPIFNVTELDTSWNRMPYQWGKQQPDGKINHFFLEIIQKMIYFQETGELSIFG